MVQHHHFERHLLESNRNRRRLRVALAGIFVAAVGLVTLVNASPIGTAQLPSAQAATDVPATPINFQALVLNDNAVISLSWAGTADATPVKAYKLERSIDQVNWTSINDSLSELQYRDDKVAFAVHYYYRLTAFSQAGKASGFAYADATTGAFAANSSDIRGSIISSDDKVASVEIPTGALADRTVSCSIGATNTKPARDGYKFVSGPYVLVCKKPGSDIIAAFLKPVIWRVQLKDKLGNLIKPIAVQIKSSGGVNNPSIESVFDSKSEVLSFYQMTPSTVAIYATQTQGLSPSLVAIFIFVILLVVGVCILVLRKKQEADYYEHLTKKYDNL